MSETPQEYLARIGAVGGAKSRRKLSKKEARRIAKVRWAAGAGRGAVKPSKQRDGERGQALPLEWHGSTTCFHDTTKPNPLQ